MLPQPTFKDKDRILRLAFYFFWVIAALIQANFTELFHDEAYYWQYSNNLAWGYFDHPPIIALLIKAGYLFFQNELGIRLFIVMMSTLTIYLLERLIQPTDLKLFYAIILSIGVFHVGGIIAVPDIPLMFFSITFFMLYKRYLEKDKTGYALLLAVNIALLLFSKYHGILVIGLCIIATPVVLKRKSFWLMILYSLILFSPHLYWQYAHEWASFKYHLVARSLRPYQFRDTLEYLAGQLLLPGPVAGVVLLYFAVVHRINNEFERALKLTMMGIYVFFFFMTFKGGVEANWTIVALLPVIYFGYQKSERSIKAKRFIYYSLPFSLALVIAARFFLVYDFLPPQWGIKTQFHHWEEWAQQIKSKAGDSPVVFTNSYQYASKYAFYGKGLSHSMTTVNRRENQYALWDYENKLQGNRVMFVPNWDAPGVDTIQTKQGSFNYRFIDNYRSFGQVKVITEQRQYRMENGKPINIKFKIINVNPACDFEANTDYPVFISYQFIQGKNTVKQENSVFRITNNTPGEWHEIEVTPPFKKGLFDLRLSIHAGWLPPTLNSGKIKFEVR